MHGDRAQIELLAPRALHLKDGREALIRPVTLADVAATIEIDRCLTEAGVGVVRSPEQAMSDPEVVARELHKWTDGAHAGEWGCRIIAAVGGRPAGGAKASRERFARIQHVAHVSIGIVPEFQGLGLGRAMMLALIDWARATQAVNRLTLDVFAHNPRAITLYRSLGFVAEGCRRRHIREPDGSEHDDLLMALLLDEHDGKSHPRPR